MRHAVTTRGHHPVACSGLGGTINQRVWPREGHRHQEEVHFGYLQGKRTAIWNWHRFSSTVCHAVTFRRFTGVSGSFGGLALQVANYFWNVTAVSGEQFPNTQCRCSERSAAVGCSGVISGPNGEVIKIRGNCQIIRCQLIRMRAELGAPTQ